MLVNVDEVCGNLKLPPAYLPMFIGYNIGGAEAKYEKGENAAMSFGSVGGNLPESRLNEIVEIFIRDWVLCPRCERPEVTLTVAGQKRDKSIRFACAACGFDDECPKLNLGKHPKFYKYICSNPPSPEWQKMYAKHRHDTAANEEEEKGKKKSSKKQKDVVWHTDASVEAVKERELQAKIDAGVVDADDAGEDSMVTCANELAKIELSEVAGAARTMASERGLGKHGAVTAVFLAAVDSAEGMPTPTGKALLAALKPRFPAFAELNAGSESKQVALLKLIESWMLDEPGRVAAVGKALTRILHTMYEEEVIEEGAFTRWFSKRKEKHADAPAFTAIAQPFLAWLSEAESSEEESE